MGLCIYEYLIFIFRKFKVYNTMLLTMFTTNKASGGNGIPVELFQILKDDASKFGKLSCGHRTGKGQFSF